MIGYDDSQRYKSESHNKANSNANINGNLNLESNTNTNNNHYGKINGISISDRNREINLKLKGKGSCDIPDEISEICGSVNKNITVGEYGSELDDIPSEEKRNIKNSLNKSQIKSDKKIKYIDGGRDYKSSKKNVENEVNAHENVESDLNVNKNFEAKKQGNQLFQILSNL